MIENGTIPVKSGQDYQQDIHDYIDKAMQNIIEATGGPITPEELRKLEIMESEDWDIEEEYKAYLEQKDKKVLH